MPIAVHFRINARLDTPHERVVEFIKQLSINTKYIIGLERIPHYHFHVHFIYESDSKLTDYRKKILNKQACEFFGIPHGKSLTSFAPDKGKSEIYCTKDNEFIYSGYSEEEIAEIYAQSSSKVSLKQQLDTLYQDLLSSKITFRKYCETFVKYKVTALKPLSDFQVEAHFRTVYLSVNPSHVQHYADSMLLKATQFLPHNYSEAQIDIMRGTYSEDTIYSMPSGYDGL